MTFCSLGVAKFSCTSLWEWLFVTFRRGGEGGQKLMSQIMTLRNPKIVWKCSLATDTEEVSGRGWQYC